MRQSYVNAIRGWHSPGKIAEVTGVVKSMRKWWPAVVTLVLVAGCGQPGTMAGTDVSGSSQNANYGQTKSMVIDILRSQEGQTALEEIAKDPKFKQAIAVTETDVAKAVEKTITQQKEQSFLSQQAKDPQFAATLAKAIEPQLVQVNKTLMKDPEYQKEMLVLMNSPEYTKDLSTLLQTPSFRGAIMKIMTEALQTPSFRLQFEGALKKAVADQIQQAGGQGGQSQSQGQSSESGGGGSSGSEGGDSGGGGGGGGG